jgi:hypothetical protein
MDEMKKSTISTSESNESGIENKETDGLSQRQIIVKRFFKHKAAVASLITLIGIFVVVYSSLGITIGISKFNFSDSLDGGHIKLIKLILRAPWPALVMVA